MTRTRNAKGFTLVEILIVIVILGILAAIVIPQFVSATEGARASTAASQLQTLRTQIQLYRVHHNGRYPTLVGGADGDACWEQMLNVTDVDGTINANGDFGPYLGAAPRNPFAEGSDKAMVAGDLTEAWAFSSGKIYLNVPATIEPEELEKAGLVGGTDFVGSTGNYTLP